MPKVLKHAEAITRHRDHARVDIALVTSLVDLLKPQFKHLSIRLFRAHKEWQQVQVELTAWSLGKKVELAEENTPMPQTDAVYKALELEVVHAEAIQEKGRTVHYCWFPILHDKIPLACLEIAGDAPFDLQLLDLIQGMLALYRNYLSLLHYSQVDTLTRLLNRKTFEDSLQKLLASHEGASPRRAQMERRDEAAAKGEDWLAIFDIDHFKKVNDRLGHLFGDEVLLLMADMMRKVFRRRDKLFRFGGEEFVVLVRHTSEENALKIMERFRQTVAAHRFPQLDRVTVSLGITRIRPGDSPTTVLGRADEALYYAKHHGRNQVRYYEALVKEGLQQPAQTNTEAELF